MGLFVNITVPVNISNVLMKTEKNFLRSFDDNNNFRQRNDGPIAQETLLVLNSKTGAVLQKSGANRFYMPHGLTVDHLDNVWLTDVALHQVNFSI